MTAYTTNISRRISQTCFTLSKKMPKAKPNVKSGSREQKPEEAVANSPITLTKDGNISIKILAKPGAKANNVTGRGMEQYQTDKNKKYRDRNFTGSEKLLFVKVMKLYSNIIGNRLHSNEMLKKKSDAWHDLTARFNANTQETPRSVEQLKILWRDLKAKAKKDKSGAIRGRIKSRRNLEEDELDEIMIRVVDLIPQSVDAVKDEDEMPGTLAADVPTSDEESLWEEIDNIGNSDHIPVITRLPMHQGGAEDRILKTKDSWKKKHMTPEDQETEYQNKKIEYMEMEHKKKMEVLELQLLTIEREHQSKLQLFEALMGQIESGNCSAFGVLSPTDFSEHFHAERKDST